MPLPDPSLLSAEPTSVQVELGNRTSDTDLTTEIAEYQQQYRCRQYIKAFFVLALPGLIIGTTIRASFQLFDSQDITICDERAWNQIVVTPLVLVFAFWIVPAVLCVVLFVYILFSLKKISTGVDVDDLFPSSGGSCGSNGCNCSGGGEGALVLCVYVIFVPVYFMAGSLSTTIILHMNEWAPALPPTELINPPMIELKSKHCYTVPAMSTNSSELKRIFNADLVREGSVDDWSTLFPSQNGNWSNVERSTCEAVGSMVWEDAKFVEIDQSYLTSKVVDESGEDPFVALRRANGCTLDTAKNTFTYMKATEVKRMKYIPIVYSNCSAEYPCLCELVNQTAAEVRVAMRNAPATGIPATYCSADANTPECCDTVWWSVWGSLMVPLLWIPIVLTGNVDEKYKGLACIGLMLQLVAFFFGIEVLVR